MKQKRVWIAAVVVLVLAVLAFAGYNIYRYPAMFRNLTDDSLDAPQVEELREDILSQPEKKILVAYFSYSGTTRTVANAISERTGGDLFEIAVQDGYSNVYTESNREIRKDERPALKDTVEHMDEYDIVFVGYPNWNADLPMPLYTFLEEYDFSGKTIIPFNTHGGSGFSRTVQTISELQPNATVRSDGLSISRNDVEGAESEVVNWVQSLNLAAE
ncbi:MAG: flavodoxin [Lachnospiraceae bacterium]|nr:flavodoxin [Candidatus Fimimorpha excrementavium]